MDINDGVRIAIYERFTKDNLLYELETNKLCKMLIYGFREKEEVGSAFENMIISLIIDLN